MSIEASNPSASEYIAHHLTQWQTHQQMGLVNFSIFNIDSVIVSALLGVLGVFFLWRAARRATPGVPGRFQAAVEILVEMVDTQAKSIVHNAKSRKMVAPLALVVFVWVTLLNAMDLVPVDFLPSLWRWVYGLAGGDPHHAYLRVVPTADLSVSMGMAVSVLVLSLFYNIKIKGLGGWLHELVCAPFGTSKNPVFALLLGVVNLAMQLIEFVSKTFSHGMRLFGNMYAGELLFMLIALLGGSWAFSFAPSNLVLLLLHVVLGWAWSVFDILVIVLQAFVFMMLTLVYIGQAHDSH
ncbi:MAG: F0F1 ATP synthase subunit A [Burkholderiales bacterium]|nr:F0F1 ATP synthase subunit A [Burkholderiales bacterium]